MRRAKFLVVAIVAAVVLAACGSSDTSAEDTNATNRLTVYTPPQLEDIVNELAAAYEAENPDAQLVIITGDQDSTTTAMENTDSGAAVIPNEWLAGLDDDLPTSSFGRSLVVIAVPANNPANVSDLQAFASTSGLRTAVCGEDTEFGNFTLSVLDNAGVTPDPNTIGEGCEAEALQQIADGELDAALMFRNDLDLPEGVVLLDIDESQNVVFDVSYVVVGNSSDATGFGEFLTSDTARGILTQRGYLP